MQAAIKDRARFALFLERSQARSREEVISDCFLLTPKS